MLYLTIPACNPPEDSRWNQKLSWYLVAQTDLQNGHTPNTNPNWTVNITTLTCSIA